MTLLTLLRTPDATVATVGAPTATLSQPTSQHADVTVWLQALDGTWEACGADRAIGVVPESLECDADRWGSLTASFDLRRPVFMLWPDIGAFAPCIIEVAGQPAWRGRTGETPIRDGADPMVSVQCEGMQAHLDDDVYEPFYVHSALSDWVDARSMLNYTLGSGSLYAAGQITTDSGIALSMPNGAPLQIGTWVGVVLDLGPYATAASISLDYAITGANANVYLFVRTIDASFANHTDASSGATTGYAATGTISADFSSPQRYVQLFLYSIGAFTPTADITVKFTRVQVFGATSYRSGGASALTADTAIKDGLAQGTQLLSSDTSGIQAASFAIQDLAPGEERTPREMAEAVNAFHNWLLKLDTSNRLLFGPRPSAPLLEIGAWQGADLQDAAGSSGAAIYNRCIVRGDGSDGSPVVVVRTAAQQPGVVSTPSSSPAPVNPSFDSNTSGWAVSSGTLSRDTGTYETTPAAGRWDSPSAGSTITATLNGTFKRGVTYRVHVGLLSATSSVAAGSLRFGSATDYAQSFTAAAWGVGSWGSGTLGWTPLADTSAATVTIGVNWEMPPAGTLSFWVDDLRIELVRPTVVDRRGFRHTYVLKPGFKIVTAEGQQLADIFLQAHMTTPYRGSCRITPGGVRYVLGGSAPHPSVLLTMTQQLLRMAHRIDPDTGAQGRVGTIASVKYTHRDQAAQVQLDDPRGNFDALVARLQSVQGAGQ